jgi:hypothetical protein
VAPSLCVPLPPPTPLIQNSIVLTF